MQNDSRWGHKVTDYVVDQKPVRNFLLANNTNISLIYLTPFPSHCGIWSIITYDEGSFD